MPEAIRGLVGVVHLPPMPGDPRHHDEGFAHVERRAVADATALVQGGVDALILENFGSAPFPTGSAGQRLPPHQVAILAILVRECVTRFGLPVGVNCLRNDALAAVGIAAAAGAAFLRVNVHTGAHVTDQGLIEGEAYHTLRYRQALGAGSTVAILADVLVKHGAPLAPISAAAAVRDCIDRGLADGVIVTGEATGAPLELSRLQQVRRVAGDHPVLIGSGLTPDRVEQMVPLADGAIVGTWLKQQGQVEAPVDPARVRELVQAVRGRWYQGMRTPVNAPSKFP